MAFSSLMLDLEKNLPGQILAQRKPLKIKKRGRLEQSLF
jgi:hypothetical protein